MRRAGGITGVVAGVMAVIAAVVTLFIGGLATAFEAEGAGTVIGLGWAGVFGSFLVIALGAVTINAKGKLSSVLLLVVSIVTAIVGGTLVAIFMVLALLGSIIALLDKSAASAA